MTIEEFILARLDELDKRFPYKWPGVQAMIQVQREIVEWHKNWPVLVTQVPEFNAVSSVDEMKFRMTQKIEWMTTGAYRAKFGDEPPTAPILKIIASQWSTHQDFQEEWRTP